jgi:hypothetical protein
MIRRPPTSIQLRQSDVQQMEVLLRARRGDPPVGPTGAGSPVPTEDRTPNASTSMEDSLLEQENARRGAREAMTRDERIGVAPTRQV